MCAEWHDICRGAEEYCNPSVSELLCRSMQFALRMNVTALRILNMTMKGNLRRKIRFLQRFVALTFEFPPQTLFRTFGNEDNIQMECETNNLEFNRNEINQEY